jgi:hypothetical protein
LNAELILNIRDAKTGFRNIFSVPLRLAIRDGAFQHDLAFIALDADACGIDVVRLRQVFVDVFDDSFIRTSIALGTTSGK